MKRRYGTGTALLLATLALSGFLPAGESRAVTGKAEVSPQTQVLTWRAGDHVRSGVVRKGQFAVVLGSSASNPSAKAFDSLLNDCGGEASVVAALSRRILVVNAPQADANQVTAAIGSLEGVRFAGPLLAKTSSPRGETFAFTGDLIVMAGPAATPGQIELLATRSGLITVGALVVDGAYRLRAPDLRTLLAANETLAGDPSLVAVSPEVTGTLEPCLMPNDPYFSDQWHLLNYGQRGGTAGQDISAPWAWDYCVGTSAEVVAVVDGGFETYHPDLTPSWLPGYDWDAVDGNANQNPIENADSGFDEHGTAVAGVIAATGFNGAGMCGAAPQARLVGRRMNETVTDAQIADLWNRNLDVVDIFNNSWGPTAGTLGFADPIIDAAMANGAAAGRGGLGSLYLMAAGNGGSSDNANYNWFATSPYAITVAASDANGDHSEYSNDGANILVNAPSNQGSSGGLCAMQTAATGHANAATWLDGFRELRDSLFDNSAAGRRLTRDYYELSGEVAGLLLLNKRLRDRAALVLRDWTPLARSATRGGAKILARRGVERLRAFCDQLCAEGSAGLRRTVRAHWRAASPAAFIGRPIEALWDHYRRTVPAAPIDGRVVPLSDLPAVSTTDRIGAPGYNPSQTAENGYSDYSDTAYTAYFGGTSSATPLTSGVCALILQANPTLGYRDVQQLLAASAQRNDPADDDWVFNGAGYAVNHHYGFGRVNAPAALAAARAWTKVGPEVVLSAGATPMAPIADASDLGVASSIVINQDLRVEYVEVNFNAADHPYWGDLDVRLTSPSGTWSTLAVKHSVDDAATARYARWRFGTWRCLGENARGTWTLRVTDQATGDVGTFQDWSVRIHGTSYVTATVRKPQVPGRVRHGRSFRIRGALSASAQPGMLRAWLSFERRRAGRWRVVRTARVGLTPYCAVKTFSVKTKFRAAGRYRVRTFCADTGGHAWVSGYRGFVVR
jgi:subtilisin-like proprotein convertase family protein